MNPKSLKNISAHRLKLALTKLKVTLTVNGQKLIPVTLCLGDLGEDLMAVFSTEKMVIGDTVRLTLVKSEDLVLQGQIIGWRRLEQNVIKPSYAESVRYFIKISHADKRNLTLAKIAQFLAKY